MTDDPREYDDGRPRATFAHLGPLPEPDEPRNLLLPKEPPRAGWRERERLAQEGPPGHEEALQESKRREIEADCRARGTELYDSRLRELAERYARGEISAEAMTAAAQAIEDQRRLEQPPPEPEHVEDPWQRVGPEAEMRLRAIIERGLPAKTFLDPRTGRPFDAWQLEAEQRDTSGLLELGPCRPMGESEDANPGPRNLLEDDPRLLQRILWRRRPPSVQFAPDDDLPALAPVVHDRCPDHGAELIENDRTAPANALCRREEGGAIIQHTIGVRYERDEYGREVMRVRARASQRSELFAVMGDEGLRRIQ
jgi:hypothetical protein